ncbi:helix-turn-helix domain-containing protein [Metabacillus fastidiosus]|uniref:helix-turn-helix domain-containing protein n=1 Tax=Metabacillus fastidiosus TaxID=1458 RepID=UPI003D2B0E01
MVFTRNVSVGEGEKPFGIYFTNENGKSDGIRLDDEEVEEDLTCEEFSDYLKFMRQSVQMTRKQLADAIDFNFDTVARWETGKRLPSKINTIIEAVRNEVKLRIKYKSV